MANTNPPEPESDRRLSEFNSILNIIILSVAGLAITWCTYQSALWSGIQTFRLAHANATFRQAQEKNEAILQKMLMDEAVIISFVNSVLDNDTVRIRFYIERVRPDLGAVLDSWLKQDPLHNKKAPVHPGVMEEYKKFLADEFSGIEQSKAKGYEYWSQAQHANRTSDNYVLVTVIFGVVMFLCGVAPKTTHPIRLTLGMNVVSAIICLTMLVILLTMPAGQGVPK